MKSLKNYLLLVALGSLLSVHPVFAQAGNDNPGGVTNEYNGSTQVAGQLDPYTGNARREIDDIVVAGSIGAYPLKLTRILTTRGSGVLAQFGQGGGWSHSYTWGLWALDDPNYCEDGHYCGPTGGLSYPGGGGVDLWSDPLNDPESDIVGMNGKHGLVDKLSRIEAGHYELRRGDGGKVVFYGTPTSNYVNARAYQIIDPYGQVTTLDYDASGRLSRVTEPGGRYLEFFYQTLPNSWDVIWKVTSNDGRGNVIETVTYEYELLWLISGNLYRQSSNLKTVHYDDNSQASYIYEAGNTDHTGNSITFQGEQVVHSCDDPRLSGPMKQIQYQYVMYGEAASNFAGHGQVKAEKNVLWQVVTQVTFPTSVYDPTVLQRTETRGDGPSRHFTYPSATGLNQFTFTWTDFKNQTFIDTTAYSLPGWDITDPRGNTTTYETETRLGALRKITYPQTSPSATPATREYTFTDSNNPYFHSGEKDENGNWTYFARDTFNRVSEITYPDGSTEHFDYNGFGQVTAHRLRSGGTETFTYDTRGLKQTYYPPATASDPNPDQHRTQYFYYTSGANTDRLRYVVDPRNNATWYEYNQRGQVTRVTHQDGTYTLSDYNADGTLAWSADENHPGAATDPNQRTRYTYDEYKRVLTVTNPMGETTETCYALDPDWANPASRKPLLHTTNSVKFTLSPTGKNVVYAYDENYRKTHQAVAMGTGDEAWTLFWYDEVGDLITVQDPREKQTHFGYDQRNRKIWMDNPIASERNSSGHTMNWQYDGVGNRVRETRADNTFRSWDYDSMNQLFHAYDWRTNETPTASQTTTYTHNVTNTTRSITDAKGAVYTFQHDVLGRKTSATYPADTSGTGRTETYSYDIAGNLTLYKNPGGNYKHMDYADSYDNRNRLRHSSWNNSATDLTANLSIGQKVVTNYDAANRMTDIVTNDGETTVSFGYDSANRKVYEDQTLAGYPTRRVNTPRDADGNRASLEVSGFYYIAYDYTGRNQLKSIGWFANFTYDPSGNLTSRTGIWNYANGATFTYDDVNRVTMEEQGDATHVFSTTHYQYDSVSREVAKWDQDTAKGDRFGYNAIGQMTSAAYNADQVWSGVAVNPTDSVSYNMTPLNRQSVTRNGVTNNYITNAMNQYTNVALTGLVYDGNFNLTGYGSQVTTFDADNRLISVSGSASGSGGGHPISSVTKDGSDDSSLSSSGGGETINGLGGGVSGSFVYDGLGRCVKRTINGAVRLFTYDDWKPMLDWDGSGNWFAWNIYGAGADEILARYDTYGQVTIYKQDRRGNVVALLNGSGTVVEKYTYDAFGKPTILSASGTQLTTSAVGNRFMFQGREYLSELGLYDYRHRVYHPGLGRFLQVDPLGLQTEGAKLSAGQKALFFGGQAPEAFSGSEMNLFRYCGDDPVDESDPMGLELDRQKAKEVPVVIDEHGNKHPGLFGKTSTNFKADVQLKEIRRGVFKIDPSKSKLTIKTQIATEHNGQGRSDRAIKATKELHEPRHGDVYEAWHSKNIEHYSSTATYTNIDAANAAAATLGNSLLRGIQALEESENLHEPRSVWAPIEKLER
jgi:RHS repeat-associated protein